MMNRLVRIGVAALLTTALSGRGTAWAQDEDEESSEDEDDGDPCAGTGAPCIEDEDEGGKGGKSDEGDDGDEGEKTAESDEGDEGSSGGGGMAGEADMGTDASVAMGPTLAEGKISIAAALQVGLVKENAGDPLSIAPDVWYGINNKLSAGVVTSAQAQTGFWTGLAGTGLCVSGDGCNDKVFDNIGAEALYALKADPSLGFAADFGLHALALDPLFMDVKLGVKGMWRSGSIGIGFAPSVLIALTKRGDEGGNNDQINIPVDVSYMLSPKLHIGVQTGIYSTLQNFGDVYGVPLALGALFILSPKINVAAAFSLDRVTGGSPEGVDGPGAADTRSLSVLFGYMM